MRHKKSSRRSERAETASQSRIARTGSKVAWRSPTDRSWMTVQNVGCNIGPELAKHVRQGISSHGPSVLNRQRARGPIRTGVIGERDRLGSRSSENFRSIQRIVSVVIRCDQYPSSRVNRPLQKFALTHGVVAFVLVQHGGKSEDYQVVAVGLIDKAPPVIFSEPPHAVSQRWMRVGPLRQRRGDADEYERGVIEAVERCDLESLFRG